MVKRVAMVVIAVLAVTSAAQAANQVWFEVTATGPGASVQVQGAPGVTAEMTADLSGPATFHIEMWVNDDGMDGGLTGYDISLFETGVCESIWSGQNYPGMGGWFTDWAVWPDPPTGEVHIGQSNFGNPFVGQAMLFEFDLEKFPVPGEFNWIWGQSHPQGYGWGNGNFGAGPVQWGGSSAFVSGDPGIGGDMPLAIVNNVPEPATMALIGLGLLGLVRRRR